MLQDEYLEKIAEAFTERITLLNVKMLKTIGENVKRLGKLNPSSINTFKEMQTAGADAEKIEKEIARLSEKSESFAKKLISETAKECYKDTEKFFDSKGLKNIPFDKNDRMQTVVGAMQKATADGINNLSSTTVMKILDRNKKPVVLPFKEAYKEIIDRAATGLILGYSTYDRDMKDLLKECGKSGLRVQYESGNTRRFDTAVRMNMLEGARTVQQNIREEQGEKFGADGYEITAHSKCAPDHEDIQGRQFTKEEYERLNRTLKRPIGHLNCTHRAYPIIIGISEPAYTKEELQAFKKNNHTEIEFEGKKLTKYEATQLQRNLETDLRYTADTLELANASGNTLLINETKKHAQWAARKYSQISKAADIPMHKDRVYSIDKKTDKFVQKLLDNPEMVLTEAESGGIIEEKGVKKMQSGAFYGALNPESEKDFERCETHAKKYYEEIRNRKSDVSAVAKNTGFGEDTIRTVKEHIFINKYDLGEEEPTNFYPNYDIAVSWQNLIDGKNISEKDIILLKHEYYEYTLMHEKGMSYVEAHTIAQKEYNYKKAVDEWREKT